MSAAMPLWLIINELIPSGMRYAFTGTNKGTLSIPATDDKQILMLVISDTGTGLPAGITLENPATPGFHLVSILIEPLNDTMALDFTEGTKFTFTFPRIAASSAENEK
jgi:two-component sensor histidine kinase